MKRKKTFVILLFFLVIIGGAINIQLNFDQSDPLVNVKNVEALAQGEGGAGISCYYSGTVSCPGDPAIKVRVVLSKTLDK